ncbi:hypothetical protein [Sulfitobacter sp.]|uniref:hypothetical protein n=1 Tax=Sulfitobacter sp. TaxID=1903071 RepID=UPI0030018B3B
MLAWGLVLIILPQLAMLEEAMTKPAHQLDSSVAGALERDAATCVGILGQYALSAEAPADNGGLVIPTMSRMASPTLNASAARPYILQCDRATTHQLMAREDGDQVFLNQLFNLPDLSVAADALLDDQIELARQIEAIAAQLYTRLQEEEANASQLGFGSFAAISKLALIPRSAEAQA